MKICLQFMFEMTEVSLCYFIVSMAILCSKFLGAQPYAEGRQKNINTETLMLCNSDIIINEYSKNNVQVIMCSCSSL